MCHISSTRCSIAMGFGSKWSIWNGLVSNLYWKIKTEYCWHVTHFPWSCHISTHTEWPKVSIADVANSKCHQQLEEFLIIFTCTIQEISKVVCKKTMSEMRAFIGKLVLYEMRALASVCCANRIALSFAGVLKTTLHYCTAPYCGRIENNFADFSDVVQVIKNQDFVQPLVAFSKSNISYLLSVSDLTFKHPILHICRRTPF